MQVSCMRLHGRTARFGAARHHIKSVAGHWRLSPCRAQGTEEGTSTTDGAENVRIKRTLADLDALLGIKEEPKANANGIEAKSSIEPGKEGLRESEAQRPAGTDSGKVVESEAAINDQMKKILDKARLLANEQSAKGTNLDGQQKELKQEFDQLLSIVLKPESGGLDKDELKKLKEAAFGPMTFWVTETRSLEETAVGTRTGVLVRGNLRDEQTKVFELVSAKVKQLFGGKYEVLMVEDPEINNEEGPVDSKGMPRVAFQIIPAAAAQPPASGVGPAVVALLLQAGLLLCALQLGLSANITKLPKETLDFYANPAAELLPGQIPPGLEGFDPSPLLDSAWPIVFAVLGVSYGHEVGHRLAAALRGVKLGPSFFVPNLQIGTFGAVTPLASMVNSYRDLWDVAASGPFVGGAASLGVLAYGLLHSQTGADGIVPDPQMLVAVPTQLFQGSLLLGSVVHAALGDAAMRGQQVMIHPLVIAGWCGAITTALNLLPVGSLDGGRMVQSAYGKRALALSSFFTYVGLGLGLLGSSLSLPFGLYVLIVQRSAEKFVRDSVTTAPAPRQALTAVVVLTAVLVLVPMAPELADTVGVGQASIF